VGERERERERELTYSSGSVLGRAFLFSFPDARGIQKFRFSKLA